MSRRGDNWKDESVVRKYLDGIRGAILLAREQIDVMLRLIEKAGGPVEGFLDIGSGAGALTLAMLEQHPKARATLVDFSEPMLTEARGSLAPYGKQCAILTADLGTPDWLRDAEARAPFDAAVSGFAIHHLTDERKRDLYAEVFALLRAGAFFINIEHVRSPTAWLAQAFDELLIDSFFAYQQSIGSGKSRDEIAAEYVHRPDKQDNILASVEDQCDWLRACGYEEVDCYLKLFELAVFGGRKPAS